MRRLPIYFLIDTSRSMTGSKIAAVNEGLSTLIDEMRHDPTALEVGYVSIITFSTEAQQVLPLSSILDLHMPQIKAIGWTNLELGLTQLMDCMEREIVWGDIKMERKGDYKPIVIIFSDGGQSRGDWHNVIKKTHELFAKCQNVTAFVATGGTYRSYFNELKEIVGPKGQAIALDDFDSNTFIKVIDIVSQSLSKS